MPQPITTILFDMDNTLFDFVGAQIDACNAVAASLGRDDGNALFENYFLSDLRGFESRENIRDYLMDRHLPVNGNFHSATRIYEQVKLDNIVPYNTVRETLDWLKTEGYPMAVITDAHSLDALRRLEKSGLMQYFSGLVAWDMVRIKKPAPEPFLFALEMMKATPSSTILIGDSPRRDIRPARDLGMYTAYARYGDRFSNTSECADASWIIDRMDELIPIISYLRSENGVNRSAKEEKSG